MAVDHAGISTGMIGPFLPGLAVGFWCRPELFHLYLGGILAITLLGIVLQQDPRWWSPGWKRVRVVTFGAAAVFALLPMTHMLWLARSNAAEQELAVPFLLRALGSLSMLAVGAAFFVTQVGWGGECGMIARHTVVLPGRQVRPRGCVPAA